jgi:GR25 family glycosyltransferase involved in LPS biosynthesis
MIFEDDVILNKNMSDILDTYLSLSINTDVTYWGIKQDFRKQLIFY